MFRKMRRFKQALSEEECINVLVHQKRGVLSLIGEDGYPYGIPMDHYYDPKTHMLYFHGAKEGHKIDAIMKNNKVSYTVINDGVQEDPNDWPLTFHSVICFGRIEKVEDPHLIKDICIKLALKFADDKYAEDEFNKAQSRVQCLAVTIDHMSGKRVIEH